MVFFYFNSPSLVNAYQLFDKKHFKWLGRFDHIINSGGLKFIPEQIESKIISIIPENFFIAGIPDEKLREKIVLIIESEHKKENINFKKYLSPYEIPQRIFCVQQFKKNDFRKNQTK